MTSGTGRYQHPYQQRVVTEKAELDEKLAALTTFTGTESFRALPEEEQILLLQQGVAMRTYSDILAARIERF
jgi:hypothetical protein